MNKLAPFLLFTAFFVSISAFAASKALMPPCITFQLQVEKWVKTTTARVIVSFDGTINVEALANVHHQVLEKLSKLSPKTDWYITHFDSQPDKSGLEKIHLLAESRIGESELAPLRERAKVISKPGATFEINQIQFSPSVADIEQTKTKLRQQIYDAAKAEQARLNQIYARHYRIYRIALDGDQFFKMTPANKQMILSEDARKRQTDVSASAPFAVSQKITMTGKVMIAEEIKEKTS